MEPDVATAESAPKGKAQFRHWQSLSDGFLVSLVIVGPSFLFEELWRGKPMIDQGGFYWLIPGTIMALGFLVGGSIAGRHRQYAKGAFNQGLLVAGLTVVLIFIADALRRLVLSQAFTPDILGLWLALAAGALLVGGVGGAAGRRRTHRLNKRSQMNRFF
jgi:hypothetical protein